MTLFGMGEFLLSEVSLSYEEKTIDNPEGEAEGLVMQAELTALDWDNRRKAGLTNDNILQTMEKFEDKYAYSILAPELRQLYAEMYLILANYTGDIPLCTTNVNDIIYVSECIYMDCPEFYYHVGYEYIKSTFGGKVVKICYKPYYSMTAQQILDMQKYINEYTTNCLAGIRTDMDAYHKIKYVYEYLIMTTEYDETADHNQNICSVACYGRTLCLGYAKMMQYLLQELNMKCAVVIGENLEGVSHAWNLVEINNAYYYVDPTWGDTSYSASVAGIAEISYDYLCITTDELMRTHVIDSYVPLPRCVFIYDNYYVREGCYIDKIDPDKFNTVFSYADKSLGFVSIKCSDESVFEAVGEYLIDERRVTQYLNYGGGVQYVENEKMYTYTFFL